MRWINRSTVAWAEGDQIAGFSAGGDAGGVIISIGISLRAGGLEDPGVCGGLAGLWGSVASGTAIPGGIESRASTLAGHDSLVVRPDLEAHGAHEVEVADAAGVAAFPRSLEGSDGDGEIVAVHEADVVEVLVVAQGELGERGGRGAADAVAEEGATAVPGGAAAAAGGVEGAAVAAPEATRPERREL